MIHYIALYSMDTAVCPPKRWMRLKRQEDDKQRKEPPDINREI